MSASRFGVGTFEHCAYGAQDLSSILRNLGLNPSDFTVTEYPTLKDISSLNSCAYKFRPTNIKSMLTSLGLDPDEFRSGVGAGVKGSGARFNRETACKAVVMLSNMVNKLSELGLDPVETKELIDSAAEDPDDVNFENMLEGIGFTEFFTYSDVPTYGKKVDSLPIFHVAHARQAIRHLKQFMDHESVAPVALFDRELACYALITLANMVDQLERADNLHQKDLSDKVEQIMSSSNLSEEMIGIGLSLEQFSDGDVFQPDMARRALRFLHQYLVHTAPKPRASKPPPTPVADTQGDEGVDEGGEDGEEDGEADGAEGVPAELQAKPKVGVDVVPPKMDLTDKYVPAAAAALWERREPDLSVSLPPLAPIPVLPKSSAAQAAPSLYAVGDKVQVYYTASSGFAEKWYNAEIATVGKDKSGTTIYHVVFPDFVSTETNEAFVERITETQAKKGAGHNLAIRARGK